MPRAATNAPAMSLDPVAFIARWQNFDVPVEASTVDEPDVEPPIFDRAFKGNLQCCTQ
jgi:hypothetical protein